MKNAGRKYKSCYCRNGKGEELFLVLNLKLLASDEMSSMDIDYGVKVMDVNNGKFKDIGIARGYIILGINGKKGKNSCRCERIYK